MRVIKDNPKYFFTNTRNRGQVRGGVEPLEVGSDLVGEPERCSIFYKISTVRLSPGLSSMQLR